MIQIHEIQYVVTPCQVEDCGVDATHRLVLNVTDGYGLDVCKPHLAEIAGKIIEFLNTPESDADLEC